MFVQRMPRLLRCAHWVEERPYSCSDPGAGISECALGNRPGMMAPKDLLPHAHWTSFLAVNRHLPQRVSPCLFCYLPCRSMRVLDPGAVCRLYVFRHRLQQSMVLIYLLLPIRGRWRELHDRRQVQH